VLKIFQLDVSPGSTSRWCALASWRKKMYRRNAPRLTFSDSGFATNNIRATAYHTATCALTFTCCDECPNAHQTVLYMSECMYSTRRADERDAGMRMIAPDAMGETDAM